MRRSVYCRSNPRTCAVSAWAIGLQGRTQFPWRWLLRRNFAQFVTRRSHRKTEPDDETEQRQVSRQDKAKVGDLRAIRIITWRVRTRRSVFRTRAWQKRRRKLKWMSQQVGD